MIIVWDFFPKNIIFLTLICALEWALWIFFRFLPLFGPLRISYMFFSSFSRRHGAVTFCIFLYNSLCKPLENFESSYFVEVFFIRHISGCRNFCNVAEFWFNFRFVAKLSVSKNVRYGRASSCQEVFVKKFEQKEPKLYVLHENGIRISLRRLVKEIENFLWKKSPNFMYFAKMAIEPLYDA